MRDFCAAPGPSGRREECPAGRFVRAPVLNFCPRRARRGRRGPRQRERVAKARARIREIGFDHPGAVKCRPPQSARKIPARAHARHVAAESPCTFNCERRPRAPFFPAARVCFIHRGERPAVDCSSLLIKCCFSNPPIWSSCNEGRLIPLAGGPFFPGAQQFWRNFRAAGAICSTPTFPRAGGSSFVYVLRATLFEASPRVPGV